MAARLGREKQFGSELGLFHQLVLALRRVGADGSFISRLAHDVELLRLVVDAVEYRTRLTTTELKAATILGRDRVLGYIDVCRIWHVDPPRAPDLPFSDDILRECAVENARGIADWRLAYVTGLSLREQHKIRGVNSKRLPCFKPVSWGEETELGWDNLKAEPGYRLYNFAMQYPSMSWQDQAEKISELGKFYERAEGQTVAEICFSSYILSLSPLTHGILLGEWAHWSDVVVECDRYINPHHVAIGINIGGTLWVCHNMSDNDPTLSRVGVVIARKPK